MPLQRADADSRSRLANRAETWRCARQRAAELQSRMADARNRYQQAATEEHEAIIGALARAGRKASSRRRTRWTGRPFARPSTAWSWDLRVTATGEVLAAGAAILDVVPSNEMLVVEARIRPQDINHVFADAKARRCGLAAYDCTQHADAAGPRHLRIARIA